MHTLESSLWCLLTTSSYEDALLNSVNLGNDTDTTMAVAEELAGLLYGDSNIPEKWLAQLARRKDIVELCLRFAAAVQD